jgi:hypothetical protein
MKDSPILFGAPMVRALLDGSKTQTRRVVNPTPVIDPRYCGDAYIPTGKHGDLAVAAPHVSLACRYGSPGDQLWVREAWRIGAWNEDGGELVIDYMASDCARREWLTVPDPWRDGEVFMKYWEQSTEDCIKAGLETGEDDRYHWEPGQSPCRKRPSIHMPRWASRITLEVTGVRVERLQSISAEDALAEGITLHPDHHGRPRDSRYGPVATYQDLWESINGAGSWDLNPWVWVIEFKVVKP